jgi:hypothetical protein
MAQYYFLVASLPPLQLNGAQMPFAEFRDLLSLNLTKKDWKQFKELLWPIDLYNVRALWMGLPLDERGGIRVQELEERLVAEEDLPEYLVDFLARYEGEERLRWFSSLYVSFYGQKRTGFLQRYFALERVVRLVLLALRAKEKECDVARELQFEDPTDWLVADILAQKDAAEYTPSVEFEALKALFDSNLQEPLELEMAILRYKLAKVEEMEEVTDFGIDRILAYAARYLLIEDITRLDPKKGMERLTRYA